MAVYYMWINFDKRQFLGSDPFACGLKVLESCWVGSDTTDAACSLLASDWNGDFVAFVGDEDDIDRPKLDEPIPIGWERMLEAAGPLPYDYAEDWYDDIAGEFEVARGKTGWFSVEKGPDGDFGERPYTGPFDRHITRYRYVVNDTKKVYYDRGADPASGDFDPLPLLMSTSWGLLDIEGEIYCSYDGIWMGDRITPANVAPSDKAYVNVTGRYSYI